MLREWKFNLGIQVDRNSPTSVYLQVAHAIIGEIRRGRLLPGGVMPGSRELSELLKLNRKTVINAYDELIAQGWLKSEGTKGTFVSSELPVVTGRQIRRFDDNGVLYEGPQFKNLRPASDVPAVFPEAGILCLDDGIPDTRLFPTNSFSRAYRGTLTLAGRQATLGYGDPRGSLRLRRAISRMLNVERGLTTSPDTICLTRGSQMAIYLTGRMMLRPGDAVVVEQLTYPPAREVYRACGAEIIEARLDENGIDVEHLHEICETNRVRLVYLTPHHQFPTTVSLRPERRLKLLSLADQYGFAIVEDDYDYEFQFDHQPLLPLTSSDPSKVIYIGSMSKLLSPNLRMGYISAPTDVIQRAAKEILLIDRQGDQAAENAVAELIESGEVRRHARKALAAYSQRRLDLAELLKREMGDVVTFALPDGGLAFWLKFKNPQYVRNLDANARKIGLTYLPSAAFGAGAGVDPGIRMGFASLNDIEMNEAVRRLRLATRQAPQG